MTSSEPFHLRVRLAEPLRGDGGEFVIVDTPVANVGELLSVLERTLPDFSLNNDELYNFAVNGELIVHGENAVALRSGDEVELLVAFAGG